MRRHAQCSIRAAAITLTLAVWLAPANPARSQVDGTTLDHLKCYQVHDSLAPAAYVADLRNQFGLEPGCRIRVPARLFCVESEKRILAPQPPGGGPSGTAAGHFLCYAIRCPVTAPIPPTQVEDQFGRRTITLNKERVVCAPADKLLCGDGDLDPGEACDPGSAATNVCPGGAPCNADCTCPPADVCCQCPDVCVAATGTICPPNCQPVVGAACINNVCQTCPCGDPCTDAAGNVGICRQTDPASPLCECVPQPCECGTPCTTPDGQSGTCAPVPGTTDCRCEPPPQECQCGKPCVGPNGLPGRCRPLHGSPGVCACAEG